MIVLHYISVLNSKLLCFISFAAPLGTAIFILCIHSVVLSSCSSDYDNFSKYEYFLSVIKPGMGVKISHIYFEKCHNVWYRIVKQSHIYKNSKSGPNL